MSTSPSSSRSRSKPTAALASSFIPTAGESILAGSLSGMAAISVCHPLDVLRTKLQVRADLSWTQAVVQTWSSQGVKGFYGGFWMPFCAQALYKSIIFGATAVSQRHIFQENNATTLFGSGVIAGSINALVVAPIEMVRTAQILSRSDAGIYVTVQKILSRNGISGLWMGVVPAIARDGPGIGFYMLAFDVCKRSLLEKYANFSNERQGAPMWIRMLSGSMAGIAFWTWALPLDTIKTLAESATKEYRSEHGSRLKFIQTRVTQGLRVTHLFKALPLAYIRGIPSAAVTFTVYDMIIHQLLVLRSFQ